MLRNDSQIIKFNNYLRPICSFQPTLNASYQQLDLIAVGWKVKDGRMGCQGWRQLSVHRVQMAKCLDHQAWRYKSGLCASQNTDTKDGAYKRGDIIVAYDFKRASLYGIEEMHGEHSQLIKSKSSLFQNYLR